MNGETIKNICTQLFFWIICSLAFYAGIGGLGNEDYKNRLEALNTESPETNDTIPLKHDSVEYQNVFEMKKIEIADQHDKFMQIYPWMTKLPDTIVLLLTCCSFSLLGSYILINRRFVLSKKKIALTDQPAIVLGGFLTGLVVMGLSYLLPIVLINEGGKIRPFTLMFLSLFGGMYSNILYNKLSKYVDQLFKND